MLVFTIRSRNFHIHTDNNQSALGGTIYTDMSLPHTFFQQIPLAFTGDKLLQLFINHMKVTQNRI